MKHNLIVAGSCIVGVMITVFSREFIRELARDSYEHLTKDEEEQEEEEERKGGGVVIDW